MSKQAWEAFRAKLSEDATLQSELTRVLSAGGTKKMASAQELIAFAKSRGFEFSPDDARASLELSDQELDGVAGGGVVILERPVEQMQDFHFRIDSLSLNFSKV